MKSNKNYVTENINLKQQVIVLKTANKDKALTIQSMKQELLEYSKLRERFKVLYKENEKLKKAIEILKERGEINVFISHFTNKLMLDFADAISCVLEPKEYELLKEVLDNA